MSRVGHTGRVDATGGTPAPVRLVEVLAALALATDLGMGQPLGHAIRCALIADGLAGQLGLPPAARAEVVQVGLLRYLGCTADAAEIAVYAGDEIALAVAVAPHVMGDGEQERRAVGAPDLGSAKAAALRAHCEAAGLLAARLELGPVVVTALRHGFERWDGTGHPAGLAGEAVPLPTRIAVLARDAELWSRRDGYAAAAETVRARRGKAYDPGVADAFSAAGEPLLRRATEAAWSDLLDTEPVPALVPPDRFDALLDVLADFADAKLPYALGQSRTVARLVEAAAAEAGVDPAARARLRRAALVHDLGRVGVSNRVWDRPGPLALADLEQIRLHPYLSEQVLSRSTPLRPLAALAGAHHERLDGSGYYRGIGADQLGTEQQLLAAADAYAAMRQARPHRPALTPAAACAELTAEAGKGLLDQRAVAAVLAAGTDTPLPPVRWPNGLTDREVDVLRLACRGETRQAVADQLRLSAKTVSRHLENSYAKMGVSTRAAAALFAVAHGLLDPP
jgi:HD-GYP domain-containing protein (c-di-GMP phosphodiesterase class II)/DNA-binding CsgD family transcriptional regulator